MAQLVEQEKQASPQIAHNVAEYHRSIDQSAPQPRWLTQARESAIAQFERLGFPTTRLEQWRFTSVAPIAERTFALASGKSGGLVAAAMPIGPLGGGVAHAVSVNGHFAPALSALDRLPTGVQVLGLEATLASNPGLVEPYLAKLS